MFCKNLTKATVTFAILIAAQGAASAATVSCTGALYDISAKVSGSSACAILDPLNGNQNDNLSLINTTGFFGISNWLLDGKYDNLDTSATDTSNLFNFTGGVQTGTYTYAGGTPQPSDVMLVFKDGNDTNLVAYLLQSPYGSGTYASPFTDPPFTLEGNSVLHDISHITVYYREDDGSGDEGGGKVPEPATLALVGLGLLGMTRLRRKS